jgi:prepilin-type N-terminal cleavage/methylation domain-containing protein
MKQKDSRSNGFTLLELLTVIAIIGVLAGLLFPAIKNALLRAEVAKAQQAVNGLATAFKAYYTEYGKWPIVYVSPVTPPAAYEDFIVDQAMIALLSGDDVGGGSLIYPGPTSYHPAVDTAFGLPYGSSSATIQGNPRKVVFLEFKKTDISMISGVNYFVDPWGKPYHFRLDVTYQNQVDTPYLSPNYPESPAGFLIWSIGPDGQYDRGDHLVSTPPLITKPSALNKDNINSWQ